MQPVSSRATTARPDTDVVAPSMTAVDTRSRSDHRGVCVARVKEMLETGFAHGLAFVSARVRPIVKRIRDSREPLALDQRVRQIGEW